MSSHLFHQPTKESLQCIGAQFNTVFTTTESSQPKDITQDLQNILTASKARGKNTSIKSAKTPNKTQSHDGFSNISKGTESSKKPQAIDDRGSTNRHDWQSEADVSAMQRRRCQDSGTEPWHTNRQTKQVDAHEPMTLPAINSRTSSTAATRGSHNVHRQS